jgi:hypothetical protein
MIGTMSEACFVCGRKATRQCLAGHGLGTGPQPAGATRPICSQCCGKGRGRTLDCPDSCTNYRSGARQARIKLVELSGDVDMELRFGGVLHNLRLAVTRLRKNRLRDMKDADVRQASANVADTMRTRSSGLIFDFRSTDPRIQLLTDELLAVATLHERGERQMGKTDAVDLMKCLRYLEKQAAAAQAQGRAPTFFLDLIAQSVSSDFLTRSPAGFVGG